MSSVKVIEPNKITRWLMPICILALVIGLGVFAINQTLNYFYTAQLLRSPCQLCVDINPEWERCYNYVATNQYNISVITSEHANTNWSLFIGKQ